MTLLLCAVSAAPLLALIIAGAIYRRRKIAAEPTKLNDTASSHSIDMSIGAFSDNGIKAENDISVDTSTPKKGFMSLIASSSVLIGNVKTRFQELQQVSPLSGPGVAKNPMVTPSVAV
jgi:hypothetical protein